VTRYTNIFAIFFDYLNDSQKMGVKNNVLLNDKIQKITTPYMRFYELEALCTLGEHDYVLQQIRDYWGGMLQLGATSFWEEFNPDTQGEEHYEMYGRPFGKSLCHSWGASPIYLLGKYYLGVKPTGPGYKEYIIEPNLGDLEWMDGVVPTPNGEIKVYISKNEIKVRADEGVGTLRIKSKKKPTSSGAQINKIEEGVYDIVLQSGKDYKINYKL
jgi:hypothetical protein